MTTSDSHHDVSYPISESQANHSGSEKWAINLKGKATRSKSAGATPSIQGVFLFFNILFTTSPLFSAFSPLFNGTSSRIASVVTPAASVQEVDLDPNVRMELSGQSTLTKHLPLNSANKKWFFPAAPPSNVSGALHMPTPPLCKSAPPDLPGQRPSDASTFNGHAADNNTVPVPETTRFATYHLPIPPAPLNSLSAHVTTTTTAEDTSETCGNISFNTIDDTDGIGFDEDSELDDSRPCPNDDDAHGNAPYHEPELHPQMAEGSHKSFTPRTSIPTWLISEYKDICEQLRVEMRTSNSRKPACYDAGQFFLNPKNPFFATANQFQISPTVFYRPRYFIWLPHLFVKIPCPSCKKAGRTRADGSAPMLYLLGWPRAPRRVVDIEFCIYIFGYRYNCNHGDCKETFQSWSSAILDVLPRPLAAQFTFHLTFRCGLTDRLVALLRSSFQRGLGPTPFSEMIRNFHIRYYELLQIQYLEMVKVRYYGSSSMFLAKHVRFSSWNDKNGYAGYTPSGRYFRAFYDNFIEAHACEIDQYTAMLPARILAADHSFKVCVSFYFKEFC